MSLVLLGLAALYAMPAADSKTSTQSVELQEIRAREEEMFGRPEDVEAREAEMFGPSDEVEAREAEMFGPPALETSTTAARRRTRSSVLPTDGLSTSEDGLLRRLTDRVVELDDILTVGGRMWLQAQATFFDEGPARDAAFSSPNILDVFIDSRPSDRLRAFVQGRLNYDPTGTSGDPTGLGGTTAATQVRLDQLWLRFDIYREVFVTAGQQRIRWGSGRLWNPTDFLNQQRLNPIALFDVRLGVPLLKIHVPVESLGWNFYAVANFEEADSVRKIGGAVRAELLLGPAELSISAAAREGAPQQIGIDLTGPIWDFDLRAELALIHGDPRPRLSPFRVEEAEAVRMDASRSEVDVAQALVPSPESRADDWIPQLVLGAEIAIRYSDEDNLILGVEYFFNDAGYADEDVYPRLILANQFNPLDVGRHYLGLFMTLVGPGEWDDTTFLLSAIANMSDLSGVVRADVSQLVLTFLSVRLFANVFWGSGAFSPDISLPTEAFAFEDPNAVVELANRLPLDAEVLSQLTSDAASTFAPGGLPLVQVGLALVIDL